MICPDNIDSETIVYSFGVGDDISFDLAMIKHFDLNVFAFDPTPRSIRWIKKQHLPQQFKFFEFGLADYDGTAVFLPPENPLHMSYSLLNRPETGEQSVSGQVFRLETIAKKLGHRHINILKMDIEGAEYAVIADIEKSSLLIDQILVEFHHRFDSVSIDDTKQAIKALNEMNYKVFSVSESGFEFSLIKT